MDDASRDGSPEALGQYAEAIQIIELPRNRGAPGARNQGAASAKGEYDSRSRGEPDLSGSGSLNALIQKPLQP